MKKIIATIMIVLSVLCFSTVSAHADRKTMEGFMLGTGVAILGAAIYNGIHHGSNVQYIPQKTRHNDYSHRRYNSDHRYKYKNKHHRKYSRHNQRGHWEVRKEWINPLYENRWNPGHYTRKGRWISGRNINILVRQGYWQENKIWVRY